MTRFLSTMVAILVAGYTAPASAGNVSVHHTPDIEITAGIGYGWLEANDLGYEGGNRVFQLTWESEVPVLTFGAKVNLPRDWYVSSNLSTSFAGNSYMGNYQWWEPLAPSYDFDDWSDRILHPATNLDHYVDIDIALGHNFILSDSLEFDLHGGFKYTSAKWTAHGGNFIYSDDVFRDWTGSISDDFAVTSYEQNLPGIFLGAGGEWNHDNWTFSGRARGGVAFDVEGEYDHILAQFFYTTPVDTMPFLSLAARMDYRLTERSSFYLAGNYDHYFRRTGDRLYRTYGSTSSVTFEDGASSDFSSLVLHAGFKMDF